MRKIDVITKEDLETYYNKCRKIKFKNNVKIKSYYDICKNILIKDNSLETVYIRNGHHCDKNKYRSLNDVIIIFKHYFPKITICKIFNEIFKYEDHIYDNYKKYLAFGYCSNIRKSNFQGYSLYESFYEDCGGYNFSFKTQGFPNCDIDFSEFIE